MRQGQLGGLPKVRRGRAGVDPMPIMSLAMSLKRCPCLRLSVVDDADELGWLPRWRMFVRGGHGWAERRVVR